MVKKKFTIEDYDNRMEDVRQRHRKPTTPLLQRLKEATRKRKRI